MAEHFTGYGMPSIDFSGVGQLGDVYQKNRQGATRERVLSDLGKGTLDYGKASQALLAAGDTEGGLSLARLAESRGDRSESRALRQQQFEFQKQEAARAQSNADRSFEFQKSQAAEKPAITWQGVEGEDKVPYLVDPRNPDNIRRLQPAGGAAAATPTNPFAPGGKSPTEAQSKDAGYATRMFEAEKAFQEPEVIEAGRSYTDRARNAVPIIGNALTTVPFQKYDQASRNFINATLRRESGAVISESEFANAKLQYLPQPGDGPEKLKMKAANRRDTIASIAGGAGKGYKPPYLFGENGELVDANPRPGGAPGKTQDRVPPQEDNALKYQKAVVELRARMKRDPRAAEQFDEVFGVGAAARELGVIKQ